ncbi:MAG TPA: HEAT repeat domain-containing protein [Bryobacteraceae bacterium]|nr:HEAT repeat domain-containing protein [Bryobacteraceae bacterium]
MRPTLSLLCLFPAVLCATDAESAAWDLLNHGLSDGGTARRIQAVTALGSIGIAPHVIDLLEVGLADKEITVRMTAAAVLGEMQARPAIPRLRQALDDVSVEVNFAAAQALWKMGDQSGREILWGVLAGERKTGPGMIQGEVRDAKNKMHNPAALARLGINEAAGQLGPFSMGVWFAEELLKDKGATARTLTARLLATDPDPRSIQELENNLDDKSAAVRAAVARAIGQRGTVSDIPKLEPVLNDSNEGVRLMAAAAIVRLSEPPAKPVQRRAKKPAATAPASK